MKEMSLNINKSHSIAMLGKLREATLLTEQLRQIVDALPQPLIEELKDRGVLITGVTVIDKPCAIDADALDFMCSYHDHLLKVLIVSNEYMEVAKAETMIMDFVTVPSEFDTEICSAVRLPDDKPAFEGYIVKHIDVGSDANYSIAIGYSIIQDDNDNEFFHPNGMLFAMPNELKIDSSVVEEYYEKLKA